MADPKEQILRLVRRAQNGDAEAFGKIYDLMLDKIYRFVFFRVGRREDAEDITEAVFLKAWQGLRSYKEVGPPFEAWLFKITRNAVIDHWRTRKQSVSIEAFGDIEDSHNLLPDEIVSRKSQIDQIYRGLKKIRSSYQEIIILKFFEENYSTGIAKDDELKVLPNRPNVGISKNSLIAGNKVSPVLQGSRNNNSVCRVVMERLGQVC